MIVKGNKIVSIIKTITNTIDKATNIINNSLRSFIRFSVDFNHIWKPRYSIWC